jgi:predicted Na+-dependent transporter
MQTAVIWSCIQLAEHFSAAISCRVFRIADREAVAVVIMGSAKTLPMAVTVIAYLPASLGPAGQLAVPCVLGQVGQILMDAAMVPRISKWVSWA